jgi:hypothetical protein
LHGEIDGAAMYRTMADLEPQPERVSPKDESQLLVQEIRSSC